MDLLFVSIMMWIHLFTAIIFIGGSFFIWIVVWPASFELTDDEKFRTKIVGTLSKRFALFTNISVILLVISGIFLAYAEFGVNPGFINTFSGQVLSVKVVVVVIAIGIMYYNNLGHAKKIGILVREGKTEEVKRIRKTAHLLSYITLALLVLITILGAILESV
ncbi:MAG: CopD family protein [Candidatus Thermoplasmatota archaeon]|jgi:uncharacterized membrane protein|nr:CopD family protein [Candidatus Thermoplasmatota archaeon]MCL5785414.1 CopD family protein [Candidatus Thermoplasmatota archaeon]